MYTEKNLSGLTDNLSNAFQDIERERIDSPTAISTVVMRDPEEVRQEDLMRKWGVRNPVQAEHMQWWATDPNNFAKVVVASSKTLAPDVKERYINKISTWIREATRQQDYKLLLDQIEIGNLGSFGWTFLPELRNYYWGRHVDWNLNDFITNISDTINRIQDEEVLADTKEGALSALEEWAKPDWINSLSSGLKAKFLKAFFPEEIEAAAIETQKAADKNRLIGISIAVLIGGTLIFSLGKKKKSRPALIK